MTASEIVRELRHQARESEKRSRTNRYYTARLRAAGAARAYRNAVEWILLLQMEERRDA